MSSRLSPTRELEGQLLHLEVGCDFCKAEHECALRRAYSFYEIQIIRGLCREALVCSQMRCNSFSQLSANCVMSRKSW